MKLKTLYMSVLIAITVVHCCSCAKEFHVYTTRVCSKILQLYAEADKLQNDETEGKYETYITIDENTKDKFINANKDNLPWALGNLFSNAPLENSTNLGPDVSSNKPINWGKIDRLIKEAEAAYYTLNNFAFREYTTTSCLSELKGPNKKIIVISGYGNNGYHSGWIGLKLYEEGYNVVVVGMPSHDGTRPTNLEIDFLRRQFVMAHLDYCKNKYNNSFEYIEIHSIESINNEIPTNGNIYLEGHMGCFDTFGIDGKYAVAMIEYLNKIKTSRTGAKILSIDGPLYLHDKYGINRYQKGNIFTLPFLISHEAIYINFVPAYIFAPELTFEKDVLTDTMVLKTINRQIRQMGNLTIAVAIVEDVYTFLEKTEWRSKWDGEEKYLPYFLPNYKELFKNTSNTDESKKYTSCYCNLANDLYTPVPTPEYSNQPMYILT